MENSHREDDFRHAEGQLDLFVEEERKNANAFKVGILAIIGVVVLLFALPALAGEARTHACNRPDITVALTDILAEDGIEAYRDMVGPFLENKTCVMVRVPVPISPEIPPFYVANNGDFSAGVYVVYTGVTPWFAILMNDITKHPKYGRDT